MRRSKAGAIKYLRVAYVMRLCVDQEAIHPTTWGPALWRFLHTLSYQVDDRLLSRFGEMLTTLLRAIPCDACREHALRYVRNHRLLPTSSSRDAVVRYVHDFHNAVNRRLGKSQYPLSMGALAARRSLGGRAGDIARLLRGALPGQCTATPSVIELASPRDAARRMLDLVNGIALIEEIGGLRRHRAAPARRTQPRRVGSI